MGVVLLVVFWTAGRSPGNFCWFESGLKGSGGWGERRSRVTRRLQSLGMHRVSDKPGLWREGEPPDSPWPGNGGHRFQWKPLLRISNLKESGVGPRFSVRADRHPVRRWRGASGEPSVHEVRTRWCPFTPSNEQTAAKHAQSCSGNRSKWSAVAEGGCRWCQFSNPGKFVLHKQLRQACGYVLRRGRGCRKLRHQRLFDGQLSGRGIAAAVGCGWFAAGGSGVIHY